jgi:threonine dehydrogenase-like Zn-dependent dehydrogenase
VVIFIQKAQKLIRKCAGICGSDLHEYLEGSVFINTENPDPISGEVAPITLGHEFAGVIEEVGSGANTKTN